MGMKDLGVVAGRGQESSGLGWSMVACRESGSPCELFLVGRKTANSFTINCYLERLPPAIPPTSYSQFYKKCICSFFKNCKQF